MEPRRKFLINERVKAVFLLFIIMAVTIFMVFFGVETLKGLSGFSVSQKKVLDRLSFPPFFKFLVVLGWGGISILLAYLFLFYQYFGLSARLETYFSNLKLAKNLEMFRFRKRDPTRIIEDSLTMLLKDHHDRFLETGKKLNELKNRLEKMH